MELKIDLANREEVAATVPLLLLILNGAGECHKQTNADTLSVTLDAAEERAPASPLPPAAPTAPFIAGAAALPTAPVGLPGTLPGSAGALLPPAPSPEAVAPAPLEPAAPSNPVGGVELDSVGLPWDERIHSSTKSKIANGEWKVKRGVSPATITRVEAELRASVAPTATAQTNLDPSAVFGGAPAQLPPTPTSGLARSDEPATFEQLMPRLSPAVQANILPPTAIQSACATFGLTSIVGLQANPSLVPEVWKLLKQQFPGIQ